jgi:3-oxoacyl-[acyl-carrier-protein] synthase II
MMAGREIVITGAGLVTPLGVGVQENWERMKRMETGITCNGGPEALSFLRCRGQVRAFDMLQDLPEKLRGQVRFLNRGSILGFEAAREAYIHAGAEMSDVPQDRRALFIAGGDSTQVGCSFMHEALKSATSGQWLELDPAKLNESSLYTVNPFFLLESILNNLFSALSAFLECMGPNTSLGNDSPCGGNAVELAARSIENGSADVALAVGCGNWITEIPLFEMAGLGLLSNGSDGVNSFRPFDRRHDGFIPGEGGAALFLETAERAERRGAKVLGTLRGFGNCLVHTDILGLGVGRKVSAGSMQMALEEAGRDQEDYAFICGHGSASAMGDASELRSISRLFSPAMSSIAVCGLKPHTGHLGAASDIAEIILCMKAVSEGIVPATLNFDEPEDDFRGISIGREHRATDRLHFIAATYGVAGQSSAVAVEVPAA